MNALLNVYIFRDAHFSPSGNTVVCAAEKSRIEELFRAAKIQEIFRGGVIYKNWATEVEYLGVWGERNASKFRRLIRERGLQIVISRSMPPGARLKVFTTRPTEKRNLHRAHRALWKKGKDFGVSQVEGP
jgi:hypothetical protein